MPYYADIYRLQYTNTENELVTIDITDNNSASELPIDTTYHEMTGGEVASLAESDDTNEDKFTAIKPQSIIIQFISTELINLNTFCEGSDKRWMVHKYTDHQTIFKGFLVLDDLSEQFTDPPNIVTLTAIDGLGTLKDILLTKPDGTNPKGHYRIMDYISWCLQKTGLELPIYTVHNTMEESHEGEPMYDVIYLDAKTFEAEINECISCYDTLTAIFKEDCYITQSGGAWWIVRPDELQGASHQIYIWIYSFAGVFFALQAATTYNQTIEIDGEIFFSESGADVSPVRANKKVILTYDLEAPKEIICNQDFTRGTPIDDVLPLKTYSIECWTLKRQLPDIGGTTCDAYIQKRYTDQGDETERYVVITIPTAPSFEYIESEAVEVSIKDKFNFSVDYAWADNNTGASITVTIAMILLYGNDSTYWNLDDTGKWYQSNVSWSVNKKLLQSTWTLTDVDETDWRTYSVNAEPVPIDGELRFLLFAMNQQTPTAVDDTEIHYQNLQFTYIPLINGTYQTYKAQSHTVTNSDDDMKAVRENKVFISDSPKKILKGALKKLVAGKYVLAGLFYDGVTYHGVTPPPEALHPFGWIQVMSVWNQYNRTMRTFEFTAQGLRTDTSNVPDMIHKYLIGDSSSHSDNKQFMLLHKSQNFVNCEWSGFLAEVYDTTKPKVYSDAYEFKYITER